MNTIKIICFILFVSVGSKLQAQTSNEKFEQALKLKKELKYESSFALFKELLKIDSSNVEYLSNTGFLYAKIGYSLPTETQKTNFYKTAEYLAKKAIALKRNNANAHYTYAFALGRLNENASTKQKIANAKLIKTECETALQLDAKLAGCHHILGRWHRTVAGFSFLEKVTINTMFGGVPQGGSYDEAIAEFQKALIIEPHYILHYYELALSYYERNNKGDNRNAKTWAEKALTLAPNPYDPDDAGTRKKCNDLLKKIK